MEWMSENYKLIISKDAWDDIDTYIGFITETCDAPITGKKHYDSLLKKLENIQKNPTANAIRKNVSLLKYGCNVRRANFKKMAIIYTINGDTVYIHRLIAGKLITGI